MKYFILGIVLIVIGCILSKYIFPYNLIFNLVGGGFFGYNFPKFLTLIGGKLHGTNIHR